MTRFVLVKFSRTDLTMAYKFWKARALLLGAALISFSLLPQPGFAEAQSDPGQSAAPATLQKDAESCVDAPQRLPSEKIVEFLKMPEVLLKSFPAGGGGLSSRARALATTDVLTVEPLLQIAAAGTVPQKSAIAAGLAQASLICLKGNQELAAKIQALLAATQDQAMIAAFVAGTNQVEAASIGVRPVSVSLRGGAPAGGTLNDTSGKSTSGLGAGVLDPSTGFPNQGIFEGYGHTGGGGAVISTEKSASPNI
jgi:hypothetical protein